MSCGRMLSMRRGNYYRRSGKRSGESTFTRQGSLVASDFLRASRVSRVNVLSSSFASPHSSSRIRCCSAWSWDCKRATSAGPTPRKAPESRDCCSRVRRLVSSENSRCSSCVIRFSNRITSCCGVGSYSLRAVDGILKAVTSIKPTTHTNSTALPRSTRSDSRNCMSSPL